MKDKFEKQKEQMEKKIKELTYTVACREITIIELESGKKSVKKLDNENVELKYKIGAWEIEKREIVKKLHISYEAKAKSFNLAIKQMKKVFAFAISKKKEKEESQIKNKEESEKKEKEGS